MKHDELDEEFQNTFGYSGRCEGYDDDNMEQMLLEDEEDDIWSKRENRQHNPLIKKKAVILPLVYMVLMMRPRCLCFVILEITNFQKIFLADYLSKCIMRLVQY